MSQGGPEWLGHFALVGDADGARAEPNTRKAGSLPASRSHVGVRLKRGSAMELSM